MNRHLFTAAFFLGAIGVVWVGVGFIDSSFLALAMTTLIAAVYGYGALELRQFRQATATLQNALAAIPGELNHLDDWLSGVPASLRNPVRLRIEGERVGLPGPALTPYLVGLLVMLGMLGTFLGMVVTLKGAVFALEKTTDLQAIRSALAVPVAGLGLAFGTSVAGVATSAMLGLMSALSRRERMLTAQLLDTRIATTLRRFSLAHQREETFQALQRQSEAMPHVVAQVADTLRTMTAQMESMSLRLNDRLIGNQENFHSHVKVVYTELAASIDRSLRDSLGQSAHAASESIRPVVEAAMSGFAQEAKRLHEQVADTVQTQLDGVSARLDSTAATVAGTWTAALKTHEASSTDFLAEVRRALDAFATSFEQRAASLVAEVGASHASLRAQQAERDEARQAAWITALETMAASLAQTLCETNAGMLSQQREICDTLTRTARDISERYQASTGAALAEVERLVTGSEALMRSRIAAEAQWLEQHHERMDQLAALLRAELGALKDDEAERGQAAIERLAQLEAALASHLSTLGTALEAPMTRLIETASEAPRAAAEVIAQLREQISGSVARDNELLEERGRIMDTLNTLLESINHASREQRAAIDSLVAASGTTLNTTAGAFADHVAAEMARLSGMADQIVGSAVDMSSLGDTFSVAVNAFHEANQKLIANLDRIEDAMDKSMTRSDEQLAYYVAQAREIIDLSMMSQKEIVDSLRQLSARQAVLAEGGQ